MARKRELLVNIDRMRREMDEFFDDPWGRPRSGGRRPSGFTPRVDVYYCQNEEAGEEGAPRAVVKADLAGVDPDAVSLEISGRELVISGARPVRETEGRAYQQVEIPTGAFRRVIELGVEVVAERARATFDDGMLRIELPLKIAAPSSHRVPIERAD
jgi:HSP20 family protein